MKIVRLIVKIVPIAARDRWRQPHAWHRHAAERPKLFKFRGEIYSRPTGAIGSIEIRRRRP